MSDPMRDLKSIFGNALEIESPAERVAYLDQACGANASLRAEVGSAAANFWLISRTFSYECSDSVTCPLWSCTSPSLLNEMDRSRWVWASVAAGWKDFAHMQKDPDLAPLRDLPEFKALLPK